MNELKIVTNDLLWVVLKIAVVVFAVEFTVMLDLIRFSIGNQLLETLIDATLLILISSPIIYFWIIKPYIQERNSAENKSNALKQSEERWQFALESGGDGVWDWDIKSGEVFLSERCKTVLDIEVGEDKTSHDDWESTIHPDDLPRLTADLQAHFDGRTEIYYNEHRILLSNGSWRWILTRGKIVSRDAANQPIRMIGTQSDITERKQAEESMQLASLVYQISSEAMMVTDADGIIITVNPAFTKLTGYAPHEAIGNTPKILSSGRQSREFYENLWQTLKTTGHWQGEIWNRRRNGEIYAESLSINTTFGADGCAQRHVALFTDITEKKKSDAAVWQKANFDALTGLPNRALFFDRLSNEFSQARRSGKYVALLFLDLDGFKLVNDTYGHEAGDIVLKVVAQRLVACVREIDTVARLGGDEFAVLVGELDTQGEAASIAQKIIRALAVKMALPNKQRCGIGVSIGIGIYPSNATESDSLLAAADAAMYESKARGKNTYTFSSTISTAMGNTSNRKVSHDSHLDKAAEMSEQMAKG